MIQELSAGDNQTALLLAETIGYNLENKSFTSGSLVVSGAANDTVTAMAHAVPQIKQSQINEVCVKHTIGLPLAPVDDLIVVLDQLKAAGFTLGLATNDSEASAHSQLTESKVSQYFNFICGFDSGFGSKPASGMLTKFCEATDLAPSEAAMVGDSLHDIHAGINAGFGLTIGVLTGPATESELNQHADIVLTDIRGIPPLLLSKP